MESKISDLIDKMEEIKAKLGDLSVYKLADGIEYQIDIEELFVRNRTLYL